MKRIFIHRRKGKRTRTSLGNPQTRPVLRLRPPHTTRAFCVWIDSLFEPIPPSFLLPGPKARVRVEEEEAEALLHESPLVPLREEEAEAAGATKVVPRSSPVVVHPEVFLPTVRPLEADWDPLLLTHRKEQL